MNGLRADSQASTDPMLGIQLHVDMRDSVYIVT